jgi:hypothetical protein
MSLIKDLGLIAGILKGTSAPSNTEVIWYDSNAGIGIHKIYNTGTLTWEPLAGSSSTLANTLLAGSITGGTDITITSGDKVRYAIGSFHGDIVSAAISDNRTYTLPDKSGTFAMLSDITAAATPSLNAVLTVSSLTDGSNIRLSDGDVIEAVSGDAYLDLRADTTDDKIKLFSGGTGGTYETYFEMRHSGSIEMRLSDGSEYLQISMDGSDTILETRGSATGPALHLKMDGNQIGSVYADSDDLNIRCDQASDQINLMASTNVVFSIVNQGVGFARADNALTFTANDNTSISSSTLQTNGKSVIRWNRTVSASTISVRNISTARDGQFLVVINDSNDDLDFENEANLLSTKIFTLDGGTVTVRPEGAAFFMYSNDLAGWCMIAGSRLA